jgi:hypothetical protein
MSNANKRTLGFIPGSRRGLRPVLSGALAFWLRGPEAGEVRPVTLPVPGSGDVDPARRLHESDVAWASCERSL